MKANKLFASAVLKTQAYLGLASLTALAILAMASTVLLTDPDQLVIVMNTKGDITRTVRLPENESFMLVRTHPFKENYRRYDLKPRVNCEIGGVTLSTTADITSVNPQLLVNDFPDGLIHGDRAERQFNDRFCSALRVSPYLSVERGMLSDFNRKTKGYRLDSPSGDS